MPHLKPEIQFRMTTGDFQLQKNAPGFIIVINDGVALDVRPVPAAGDERGRFPGEKAAAAVEKLQNPDGKIVIMPISGPLVRPQKEICRLEIAIRTALFDDTITVIVSPRRKMLAHFQQRFIVTGQGDTFGNPPASIGGIDDSRPPEPGEIAFQRPFNTILATLFFDILRFGSFCSTRARQ